MHASDDTEERFVRKQGGGRPYRINHPCVGTAEHEDQPRAVAQYQRHVIWDGVRPLAKAIHEQVRRVAIARRTRDLSCGPYALDDLDWCGGELTAEATKQVARRDRHPDVAIVTGAPTTMLTENIGVPHDSARVKGVAHRDKPAGVVIMAMAEHQRIQLLQ